MGPNSTFLLVLLLLFGAGLIFAAIKVRYLAVKILSALFAMIMSMTAGMAFVNDYYGYYTSWSQLNADLTGSYASYNATPTVHRAADDLSAGGLQSVMINGPKSGITRQALVYLPPQYFQAKYAHLRFPVVELMHGSPGRPSDWTVHMALKSLLDGLIARHNIGPMIVVMPSINGRHFEECVDSGRTLDDTYLTDDVRSYVVSHFRASTVAPEWGVGGYSSGGYCAANLALRHRSSFGAAGIMDGYFRPSDGPAARALNNNPVAEAANNPLEIARRLPSGTSPMPSFWVSEGTGDAQDSAAAQAFAAALRGLDQVNMYRESDAGHNFYAWRAAIPPMFVWLWTQIASPEMRVTFPVTGGVTNATILVGAIPHSLPAHHGKKSTKKVPNPTSIARGDATLRPNAPASSTPAERNSSSSSRPR